MSRSKKEDDKVKDSGSLQISVEDFVRTRNSVVTGLATLQSAVSDLSRAYIAHTDTVIGRGNSSSLEQLNISNPLSGDNALFSARAPTPAPVIEVPVEGKKRKRAPHDKNAPKRALTPFFLYLQQARNTIAKELGDGKSAKEVQDEGGRRWRSMTDDDKQEWQYKYAVNFARYKEQTKAYKAGLPIPQISDDEAVRLYESLNPDGKLHKPVEIDPALVADADESSSSEDTSSEDSPPPPVKAPAPKKAKIEKKSKPPATIPEPAPVIPEHSSKSPEKKKKSHKKKDTRATDDAAESKKETVTEVASPSLEKPKNKGRKRKSAAADA
ncbi:hypothetical protein MMC21_000847 [Puttea exsequens]|nr:hypothetical protein [Puttea exsequens]